MTVPQKSDASALKNIVGAIIVTTVALTIAFYMLDKQWSLASQEATVVMSEFMKVNPPAGSHPVRRFVRTIPTSALIGSTYSTQLGREDIRAYYTRLLAKHGWSPCGSVTSRDRSDIVVSYCKQRMRADLDIPNHLYPATYDFSVNWNWP
jgi:hypothetical protein